MGPRLLIIAGILLILAGLLWMAVGDLPRWLGRLPGDIHVQRPGFVFHFPLTTMLAVSAFVTLLVALIRKFL